MQVTAGKATSLFGVGRNWSSDTRAISSIATTSLFCGIYLKDFLAAVISSAVSPVLLTIGVLFGAIAIIARRDVFQQFNSLLWLAPLIPVWIISSIAAERVNFSNYYVAIPLALMILHLNPRLFIRLVIMAFLGSLLMQVVEYQTKAYFFSSIDSEGEELDAEFFGGSLGVLRAKGLSQGPLSAVALALWVSFFASRNVAAVFLLICCAFLASGRLGMTIGICLLVYRTFISKSLSIKSRLAVLLLSSVLAALAGFLLASDSARYMFMASAFDVSNDQTTLRFVFWLSSIDLFLNYGWLNKLFGDYGLVINVLGATENDMLRILLDNGLMGFLPYCVATFWMMSRAIVNRDSDTIGVLLLLLVATTLFPFLQSLPSTLLFWVYFFSRELDVRRVSPEVFMRSSSASASVRSTQGLVS